MAKSHLTIKHLLCFCLLSFLVYLPSATQPRAYAETLSAPAVRYESVTNIIYIGSDSGATAASQAINIPSLAAALTSQGFSDLVVEQGAGVWLVKANIVISTTAQLEASQSAINELRLDSPPLNAYKIIARRGGRLLVDHIKVTAWEDGALDTNVTNQRSYLLALEGGRMDILSSEIAYLGWADGEPSGLAWRKRLTSDPATGATGSLLDSNVHHNYFGLYSFEAYGVNIQRNQVHDNLYYGIDPHDDSRAFEVAFNKVYANGKHGIIFSRDCKLNSIHDNEVYSNAQHGIMMDRGSNNNTITNNVVYQNQDGISVFQSSNNTIQNNFVHHNVTGVRINATFVVGDRFDDVSTGNQVLNNRIEDNSEQGIYLYARADRNTLADNQILRSGLNGIYIKTGGNLVRNNMIREGNVGINLAGGEYLNNPPEAKPALEPPGDNNVVISTTITLNRDTGMRLSGGKNNWVGPRNAGENGNRIESNGTDGLVINVAGNGAIATGNQVLGNIIRNNGRHGVAVKAVSSIQNRISQNKITGNGQYGIRLDAGVQQGILPPVITAIQANSASGTAQAGATVELYSDPAGEGDVYFGATTAANNGAWSYPLPDGTNGAHVTALAIDSSGNSSAFSGSTLSAIYTVDTDAQGQPRIWVTGSGAIVTLPSIKTGIGAGNASLLQDLGNGIWQLNANLFIDTGVTLNVGPTSGVNELRMRSAASTQAAAKGLVAQAVREPDGQVSVLAVDYSSFVSLITYSGVINLEGVKIYSWDPTTNAVDQDYNNGRAYILAKYDAILNIRNAELGYLGSANGESYGVSWRDVNASATPTVLRSRVTGEVLNSKFHHLYYGIYTFQASNMVFRGNEFYQNIRYGFDPHDYTHDVLVENNISHDNGAHGFIISRGCNNFVFRNNTSYNNVDPGSSQAHGFMLDYGSPNSADPQVASYDNLLENNEAYNNEGYGLRILGSTNNQARNNNFHYNQQGIVVDDDSTDNLIDQNTLNQNTSYGLSLQETAARTTVTNNTINGNGNYGIYAKSSTNFISSNIVSGNQGAGLMLSMVTGFPLTDNQVLSNTLASNNGNGLNLRGAQRTLAQGNLIEINTGSGISLTNSASQNVIMGNTIRGNQNYGIVAVGKQTLSNTWSENQLYDNTPTGILLLTGANNNLPAPQLLNVTNNTLFGLTNPTVTVEIFADNAVQGRFFLGRTTAELDGHFAFALPAISPATNVTALIIDAAGNASSFSAALNIPSTPTPTATETATATPTATTTAPAATPTATVPPGSTATATPSATATVPPGSTATATPTATLTVPPGSTATATPTPTLTPEPTFPGQGELDQHLFLPFVSR